MKIYKIFYILGLMFMTLFFLSTLNSVTPIYALLSLVSFIISAKYYKENEVKLSQNLIIPQKTLELIKSAAGIY